jgi:RNA binding exosome subunit
MKAGIFFTGTGPILLLTTYDTLDNERLAEKLASKGIKKYIAFEVEENKVRDRYGNRFNVVMGDLKQTDDLRVMDYDGHHVFYNFSLNELGEAVRVDSGA